MGDSEWDACNACLFRPPGVIILKMKFLKKLRLVGGLICLLVVLNGMHVLIAHWTCLTEAGPVGDHDVCFADRLIRLDKWDSGGILFCSFSRSSPVLLISYVNGQAVI